MNRLQRIFFGIALMAVLSGCDPTMYVAQGDILIDNEPEFHRLRDPRFEVWPDTGKQAPDTLQTWSDDVDVVYLDKPSIESWVLSSAVKTRPNTLALGKVKGYVILYNIGRYMAEEDHPLERVVDFLFPARHFPDSLSSILLNIGEEPRLVDEERLLKDVENLESMYFSRGWWNAQAWYTVDTLRKRGRASIGRITFYVEEREAAVIDTVMLDVADPELRAEVNRHFGNTLLKPGENYNELNLTSERSRITRELREAGYWDFQPTYIRYRIDTTWSPPDPTQPIIEEVDSFRPIAVTVVISDTLYRWKLNNVEVMIEPNSLHNSESYAMKVRSDLMWPGQREELNLSYRLLGDSVPVTWKTYPEVLRKVNLNFLYKLLALREDSLYRLSDERLTQERFQSLGLFKYTLIRFEPNDSLHTLDVRIQTRLQPKFQVKGGVELFSRNDPLLSDNAFPGVGLELGLRDRFLFKGGERLELSGSATWNFYRPQTADSGDVAAPLQLYYEYGGRASLIFPRALIPKADRFIPIELSPSTTFSFEYRNQNLVEYSRTSATLEWNYTWRHKALDDRINHSLSPYVITLITSDLSPEFQAGLEALPTSLQDYLALDYDPRFSSKFIYKFTYSDYGSSHGHATHFVQPIAAFGGNTPYLIDRFTNIDGTVTDQRLDTLAYGQFGKLSVEYKMMLPLKRKRSELIFRVMTGVARPWNHTLHVPFDSRFYAGGASGIRGWQSRTLGPGTYDPERDLPTDHQFGNLINPGGEILFETNLEFRQNLTDMFELAVFTDAGNVWLFPGNDLNVPGGKLYDTTVLKLGWDAGLGLRLDFGFFLFRADFAMQLYIPSQQAFVTKSSSDNLWRDHVQTNFGIGYPF